MKTNHKRKTTNKLFNPDVERLSLNKKISLAKALFIKPNEKSRTLDSYLNKEISRRWEIAQQFNDNNMFLMFYFINNELQDNKIFQGLDQLLPYNHVNYLNPRLTALIEIYMEIERSKKKPTFNSLSSLLMFYFKLKIKNMTDKGVSDLSELFGLESNKRAFAKDMVDIVDESNIDNILSMIHNAPEVRRAWNSSSSYSSVDIESLSKSSSPKDYADPVYAEIAKYPSKKENIDTYERVRTFLHASVFPYSRYKTMPNVRNTFDGIKVKDLADRFGQQLFKDILEGKVHINHLNCSHKAQNKTTQFKSVDSTLSDFRNSFIKLAHKSSNDGDDAPWSKKGYIDILIDEIAEEDSVYSNNTENAAELLKKIKRGLLTIEGKSVETIIREHYDVFMNLRDDISNYFRLRSGNLDKKENVKRAVLGTRKYLNTINGVINSNCGLLFMLYVDLFGL